MGIHQPGDDSDLRYLRRYLVTIQQKIFAM